MGRFLEKVIEKKSGGEHRSVSVRVTSSGTPSEGQVCGRMNEDPPKKHIGGMVAVELDGHESHQSKEQRQRDARRDRWFAGRDVRTLRVDGQ